VGILPQAAPLFHEGLEYFGLSVEKYPLAEAVYSVQTSTNLSASWMSGPSAVTVMTNSPDYMEVRPNLPMSLTGKQFLRLQLTPP
jgi:hypothetical protein